MFRMNQKELMRYYDMNLAQTKFLSGLGIMMILFGILIVVASLYMYMSLNTDKILLFVGSFSGIIVDFIGAIFIKMYTKILKQQLSFMQNLWRVIIFLLANSIANKIEDERLRKTPYQKYLKGLFRLKKI